MLTGALLVAEGRWRGVRRSREAGGEQGRRLSLVEGESSAWLAPEADGNDAARYAADVISATAVASEADQGSSVAADSPASAVAEEEAEEEEVEEAGAHHEPSQLPQAAKTSANAVVAAPSTVDALAPLHFKTPHELARFLVAWQLVNVTAASAAAAAVGLTGAADPFPLEPRGAWLHTVRRLGELSREPAFRWRISGDMVAAAGGGCEVAVKLIDNCLYVDRAASRLGRVAKATFFPALLALLRGALSVSGRTRLPDIAFAVYSPDRTSEDPRCAGHTGVFGYSRRPGDHGVFMLPWLSWSAAAAMKAEVAAMQEAARAHPFAERRRAAIWRGSTTGVRGSWVTRSNWQTQSRPRLTLTSKMYPGLLDAQFTARYAQTAPDVAAAIEAAGLGWARPLPLPEQAAAYRGLVDVEGNSFSDRLRLLLHANATVFKQEYEWLDFFTPALVPGQQYVPLAPDLSDVVTQLRWAAHNEPAATAVAAAGAAFADTFMRPQLAHWYTWELVSAYAQLLTEPVGRPKPSDERVGCVAEPARAAAGSKKRKRRK
jgi:hypothetical protein